MSNTFEVAPREAVKIPQPKKDWAKKVGETEAREQADQINYDLAPLDGPVIYLTHNVSD